jgi:NAD(P)-dependent dehydrogenase (short-subunit alcohol dehydrogenase family)
MANNPNPNGTQPVAVITGGSQGLGLALARTLAEAGWALVIDARRGDRLDAAAAELTGLTDGVGVPGDVSDRRHRRALADAAQRLGPVRLLVNNANTLGVSPLPRLDSLDPEVWHRIFDVNVVAPIALVRELDGLCSDHATSTSPPTPRSRPTRAGAVTARRRPRWNTPAASSPPNAPTFGSPHGLARARIVASHDA